MVSPRSAVVQLTGFAAGLGLFAWIVFRAVNDGDWSRLGAAPPWLVVALLGGTAASLLINGTTFWITVRPLKRVGFRDMQILNLAASVLNYAPLRLGAIGRVIYHLRVDGLSLLTVGAWFGMIGYILLLGVGSCVLATLMRSRIDWVWGLLVLTQVVFGAALSRMVAGHPLTVKHGRGIDRMLRQPLSLWGACVLRLADIAAFVMRMAAALAILGISLPASDTVILALVALTASLIPFGRLGFREFCVSAVAARLSSEAAGIDVPWEQLALVESAGEMLLFVPGGLLALPWLLRRLAAARTEPSAEG